LHSKRRRINGWAVLALAALATGWLVVLARPRLQGWKDALAAAVLMPASPAAESGGPAGSAPSPALTPVSSPPASGGAARSAAPSVSAATPSPAASPTKDTPTQLTTPGPAPAASPSAARVEWRLFLSQALGQGMSYLLYLPAGYDTSPTQRYPVLYLLHGIGGGFGGQNGSNTEWPGYGVSVAANRLIAAGETPATIIVMPQGDQSFWMDQANGGPKYGSYVAQDMVREIDSQLRTVPDRKHRAIGGVSMGGFGALALAMLFPDTFAAAGAHSASLPARAGGPAFFGSDAYFNAHDPVHLLHDRPAQARALKLWLDVGSQDTLSRVADEALHQQLQRDGIAHEWHEWPGSHTPAYWEAHVEDYLRFYGSALRG